MKFGLALGIAALGLIVLGCGSTAEEQEDSTSSAAATVTPLGPEPSGSTTKYPIVFANGISSSGARYENLGLVLRSEGHKAYVTHPPSVANVANRMSGISSVIDKALEETGAEKVNIIAYSMAALDTRYLASNSAYGGKIASITTVSGANHGTTIADHACYLLEKLPYGWQEKIDSLALILSQKSKWGGTETDLLGMLKDLSTSGADALNAKSPNVPGIYYQSFAGLSTTFGRTAASHWTACESQILGDNNPPDLMNRKLNAGMLLLAPEMDMAPSDGMISVEGQKWGKFRGCVPTDHWGMIGFGRKDGTDGRTGFDMVRFYRNIAFELAQLGY